MRKKEEVIKRYKDVSISYEAFSDFLESLETTND